MTYRGVLKGKTIILDDAPAVRRRTPVLVEIRSLDDGEEDEIAKEQIELLRHPHKGGKALFKTRDDIYARR